MITPRYFIIIIETFTYLKKSAVIGSGKINSNRAQSMNGSSETSKLPSNPDGDITLAATSGGSYGGSEYVESTINFSTSLDITP